MSVRILIVDDDEPICVSLKRWVNRMEGDFEAESVMSAEEALARLGEARFDAVITDVNLGSGISGPELLAQVVERYPAMGRVIMSGDDQAEARAALADGRAHAFMPKPWESHEPKACIVAAMAQVAAQRKGT